MNRFKIIIYESFDFIFVYNEILTKFIKKIIDSSIIIKKYFVIKTLNSFNFNFFIYVTIINEKIRNEKKFSKLKNLMKLLKSLFEKISFLRIDLI